MAQGATQIENRGVRRKSKGRVLRPQKEKVDKKKRRGREEEGDGSGGERADAIPKGGRSGYIYPRVTLDGQVSHQEEAMRLTH